MKLSNLSIVFSIIFLCFVSLFYSKNQVREILLERDIRYEKACAEGILEAAKAYAEELTRQQYYTKEIDEEALHRELYSGVALELGIDNQYDYAEKLKGLLPVFAIIHEDFFIVRYLTHQPNKTVIMVSSGKLNYTDQNGYSCKLSQNREAAISCIEKKLEECLKSVLAMRGMDLQVTFDLPVYSNSDFVQTIKGPSVLAVSMLADPVNRRYEMKLYGAEIQKTPMFYEIINGNTKEVHTERCERIKDSIERKQYSKSYEKLQDAITAGCIPQACCNPFSAYLYNFMSGR